jgi:hypothetical protein
MQYRKCLDELQRLIEFIILAERVCTFHFLTDLFGLSLYLKNPYIDRG